MPSLCLQLDDALTQVTFDPVTAEYSLWTLDQVKYPPGEYRITRKNRSNLIIVVSIIQIRGDLDQSVSRRAMQGVGEEARNL